MPGHYGKKMGGKKSGAKKATAKKMPTNVKSMLKKKGKK
jgi:hypothetical protein